MLPAALNSAVSLSPATGSTLVVPAPPDRSRPRAEIWRWMDWPRDLFCLLLLLCLVGLAGPVRAAEGVQALTRADRNAIQAVINLQLKAIAADDEAGAFALTAPDVRRQFGSAEAFMEMVREGYPPLLRNQSTAFLEAAIVNDDVIQPLRIINRDGTVVIALFSMERQTNGDWRVYGCQLTPSDLQAA